MCKDAVFVDVDYDQLMQKKVSMIEHTEQLTAHLPGFKPTGRENGVLARSTNYLAVGCDLRNLDLLRLILEDQLQISECKIAVLFVAEVSTAYMQKQASDAVFEWAASYEDVQFCLLEQHLPDGADHPFAQTMLKHFEKLRTPLHAIGTIDEMKQRFNNTGFPAHGVDIRSLWDLWSDDNFLRPNERRSLDNIEPFDEWEEFALFASHYFLLVATKRPDMAAADSGDMSSAGFRSSTSSISAEGPGGSHSDTSPGQSGMQCWPLKGRQSHRRFGALITQQAVDDNVALHAGQGTKERLTTCDIYSTDDRHDGLTGPPLRTGLMCHTITEFTRSGNQLLVGGRTSPDKASSDCWHRDEGRWSKVESLPQGRFRHCAMLDEPQESVLVVGGKTSEGEVLLDPIFWRPGLGWQSLENKGSVIPPTRFGAIVYPDKVSNCTSFMCGGMTEDGILLQDFWRFKVDYDTREITWAMDDRAQFVTGTSTFARFGAQCAQTYKGQSCYLIGGITQEGILVKGEEVLDLQSHKPIPFHTESARPFLVGCSVATAEGGFLVLGGGATCFSFGTHWNDSCFIGHEAKSAVWQLQSNDSPKPTLTDGNAESVGLPVSTARLEAREIPKVPLSDSSDIDFQSYVAAGQPIVFTNAELGPCKDKWTVAYLKEAMGPDRQIVAHCSTEDTMDFQHKNFIYKTLTVSDFLDGVERGDKLYLRALSHEAPSEKPTNLSTDFPSLAPDFRLPSQLSYAADNAHSSPLRISGPVNMWLHYDVMANVLCQIRGQKRLILFSPLDISHLDFAPGASSSSINLFSPNNLLSSQLAHTHAQEALLEPGDVLFIPPLWLHTAHPTEGLSVAVNVFFRNWQGGYAAGRDVYGNRDLAAYEKGRKDVEKIFKAFDGVEDLAARFYLERLGLELLGKARVVV